MQRTRGAVGTSRWQVTPGAVKASSSFALAALLGACGARVREHAAAAPASQGPSPAGAVLVPGIPAAVEGQVLDAAGEPIAGALVSACGRFAPQLPDAGHDVLSDAQGRFRFLALPPGRYGMTATSARAGAAYAGVVVVPTSSGSPNRVVLRLGGPGATLEGSVRDDKGAPLAGARVLAAAFSENEGETYVARADEQGHYLLHLPPTQRYLLAADAGLRLRVSQRVEPTSQVVDFRLGALPAPRPSDDALEAWLQAQATPLSDAPELDSAGAAAFNSIVGEARIVALGEATHGSGEFPEWRRRIFQTLVRDKGFSVYAMEAPWAETLLLDDYVVTGKGNAREAIRALVSWKDDTEETLRLVQWMRAYNADPRHERKLHFEGFDVLTPRAVTLLLEYLRRVDAAVLPEIEPTLAPFARLDSTQTYPTLARSEQERLRHALGALVARMDKNRARYAARTSDAAWARARQCARVIEQASSSHPDYAARDRQMFENIQWLVDHHPPGTKFVLGAHNNHIAAEQHITEYTGQLLRERWGARYVPIGFSFSEGSLHALDWTGEKPNTRRDFQVARAPAGTLDHDLSLAGIPRFVIDLRKATGPIQAWLHSYQRMRSIGGGFAGPDDFEVFTPARAFDAILYLDRVTAIHPLPAQP